MINGNFLMRLGVSYEQFLFFFLVVSLFLFPITSFAESTEDIRLYCKDFQFAEIEQWPPEAVAPSNKDNCKYNCFYPAYHMSLEQTAYANKKMNERRDLGFKLYLDDILFYDVEATTTEFLPPSTVVNYGNKFGTLSTSSTLKDAIIHTEKTVNWKQQYTHDQKISSYYQKRYRLGTGEFADWLSALNTERTSRLSFLESQYAAISSENMIYKTMAGRYR